MVASVTLRSGWAPVFSSWQLKKRHHTTYTGVRPLRFAGFFGLSLFSCTGSGTPTVKIETNGWRNCCAGWWRLKLSSNTVDLAVSFSFCSSREWSIIEFEWAWPSACLVVANKQTHARRRSPPVTPRMERNVDGTVQDAKIGLLARLWHPHYGFSKVPQPNANQRQPTPANSAASVWGAPAAFCPFWKPQGAKSTVHVDSHNFSR